MMSDDKNKYMSLFKDDHMAYYIVGFEELDENAILLANKDKLLSILKRFSEKIANDTILSSILLRRKDLKISNVIAYSTQKVELLEEIAEQIIQGVYDGMHQVTCLIHNTITNSVSTQEILHKIGMYICTNTNIECKEFDGDVRRFFSSQSYLTYEMYEILSKNEDFLTRCRIAENPHIPLEIVKEMILKIGDPERGSKDEVVLTCIIENLSVPVDILRPLGRNKNSQIRLVLHRANRLCWDEIDDFAPPGWWDPDGWKGQRTFIGNTK